ncbi:ABC transporter permease [Mycolicibacterium sp. 141076]|uniref:ABC transporter permease n=1 Tax=Mycobacteriaceae TaxID=1762 RepID=UPI00299E8E18|nr:ABC transporter permease [Mycolicibacterium sp. 141076]MDX1876502.1 ABC transporter permease [Mycolicibacterium sp. 141076]
MTTREAPVAAAAPGTEPAAVQPVSWISRVRARRWEILRWLSPLAVLILWQAGSAWGLIDPEVLPAPQTIAEAGIELIGNGQLAEALRVSGIRAAEGLILGGVIGAALGALVGFSKWADATVDPTMQMIRALPHLGLIPLFIVWFGIGELPKVLMVALGAAFPLYLNTSSAIRQVDPKLFETAAVLGFSPLERLRTVVIPSAAPQVLVGLRQSLAIAWLTLIVAEQINADSGVGYLINNARDFLRIDVIIFGLVVYALLGIITDALVRILERRALRYRL